MCGFSLNSKDTLHFSITGLERWLLGKDACYQAWSAEFDSLGAICWKEGLELAVSSPA